MTITLKCKDLPNIQGTALTQVTNGERTCFVIGPIGNRETMTRKRSDALFRFIITPAVSELGYDPITADRVSEQGVVTNQVIKRISKAPLVIADLSDGNPNVFYELAIRHYLRRPLVHMLVEGERLPFDLAGVRIIEYPRISAGDDRDRPRISAGDDRDNPDRSTSDRRPIDDITLLERIERTKEELKTHIKLMENDDFRLESPISAASVDLYSMAGQLQPKSETKKQLTGKIGRVTDSIIPENNILRLGGRVSWFHLAILNEERDTMATDCFSLILNTKNIRTGDEKKLNTFLKWEETNEAKLSIPPGIEKQVDAIIVSHEQPNKAFLGLNWFNMGFPGAGVDQHTLEGPGDFELNFGVYSTNMSTIYVRCKLSIGQNLDDLEFKLAE
jgi:hypothetical protein